MKNDDERALQLSLTVAELNLILESLGNQPYVRVFQLIGKIQRQAEDQLSDRPPAAPGAAVSLEGSREPVIAAGAR